MKHAITLDTEELELVVELLDMAGRIHDMDTEMAEDLYETMSEKLESDPDSNWSY